ncbi:DNA cytosine methyltransferase [Acinetobacter oleivorans]|uniref:DNA cytosine methyltransferase n=1 Tax=Acinetobacter oleivorans TaxID=1148157 RepID=UPI00125F962C|nr:DNA (cytosine-5-)-methyltransferase [Acinetobacter oleivorans]
MAYTFIDLFAGCGGFSEGFHKADGFEFVAAVEWEKEPALNLIHRLETKWQIKDATDRVLRFDIQRTNELFHGWDKDPKYGSHKGLNSIVANKVIDIIIGGPPCQAYSIAGRAQDKNSMKDDYRNYLFESYIKVVDKYKPKLFIFENVIGLLSSKPKDKYVVDIIREEFSKHGYTIISDLKKFALLDMSLFGIPQKRKRLIIIGIRNDICDDAESILKEFYNDRLTNYHEPLKTVVQAIGDLPKLFPMQEYFLNGKKYSHSQGNSSILNHIPRFHNPTDIETFKLLSKDIESNEKKYISTESLLKLYTQRTGKKSAIHKYYVLRRDEASNTIPAHLYKDGLRHIHPDSSQARSITVREAARLQTFDDDYHFISSSGPNYKMIGNALPPYFSYKLALAISQLLKKLLKYNQTNTSSNKANCYSLEFN